MPSHQPRKRFGQNFLQDQAIIAQIIHLIAPQKIDHLVEIGPGLGALTQHLVTEVGQLTLIEIDRDLVAHLASKVKAHSQVNLIQADCLQFDFKQLVINNHSLRIVGNLPYNISTPLLFHLLNYAPLITDMHFMLQREVVNRLAAPCNHKNYGRLSVMVQYFCEVEKLLDVPAMAFYPPPKVESAIVRLIPRSTLPNKAEDITLFSDVVRTAFNQRRKTIRNSLKALISPQQLTTLGLDVSLRPGELGVKEYVKISNFLSKNNSRKG